MLRQIYKRPLGPAGGSCRLAAVGDIMLSGEVARRHPVGTPAAELFGDALPVLASADIVFGNLETPLCDDPGGRDLFRGDPGRADLLADAGFDVLSLANNHSLDYGPRGLLQCSRALEARGIRVLGAGEDQDAALRPVIVDMRGFRVGFVGFGRTLQDQPDPGAPGFAEWDESRALHAIAELKPRVDALVVSLHIGLMWIDYPRPAVKEMADRLLQSGADVILMHHAHVLQGYSAADGRLAIYSLGNFIADIEEGEIKGLSVPDHQRDSAVFLIDLDSRGVVEASVAPIRLTTDLAVRLAGDAHAERIVERLKRISDDIGTGRYRAIYARQRAALNTPLLLGSLLVHLKKGNWRELLRSPLRARPEHILMLGRFVARRLGSLWRRS